MNDTPPQPALREWRAQMTSQTRVAIFAGVSVILAMMGPFNTDEAMRLAPRLAYWAIMVVACYSVGFFANELATRLAKGKGMVVRVVTAALLTSIGVLGVVYLLNGLAIGYWATGRMLAIIAGNVLVISSIITAVFHIAENTDAPVTGAPDHAARPAPLLDRLAFDKRAPLVSLSVEDHYVRIRTTKGEDMVLLRLADAMREVGSTRGVQVHRSHWIALDQVTAASRKGDGAIITLTHGPDIPVSRANVAKIKEAGLLPK